MANGGDGLEQAIGGDGGVAAAQAASASNGVQGLAQALHGLIEVQTSSGFTKHLRPPTSFQPENRSEELSKWMDWRFQFETFVGAVDASMLNHMKQAEKEENPINDGNPQIRAQSERLYSLLTALMKQRPLRLVRGVSNQNGLEAWRILTKDLQLRTRQRSLALVQALNKVQFDATKSVTEQLPQYDLMVREYEKSSQTTYPDDLKIASVVAALPPNLRVHIQMALQDDTTFEDLRQRIELYEQVSQRWMSEGGLQLSVRPMAEVEDKGGPMEVDAVWSKDGGRKGGKKGGKKGKDKGKQKGKGSWSKDGGKKGGKPFVKGDGKKGKGMGTCHNCGKPGHYAKDCWSKKVRRVEEEGQDAKGSATVTTKDGQTSASTGSSAHTGGRSSTAGVRRVRLVTPTGLATMEIFDLTQGDSNEEQETSEAEDETSELTIFAVTEIAETYEAMDDEETFYDCDEELKEELKPPSMEETEAQTSGRRDDGEAKAMVEPMKICMIKNVVALEVPSVIMTIDSGADVSVATERFYNLGVPGAGKPIEMIDAQGAKICSRGNRRLRLQAQTRDGEVIEFIEQFALGVGVTHPLLSFGRLLKQGWGLSKDDHGLFLEHPEKTVKIPARLEQNSLVMDVKICAVRAEGDEPEELQVNAVSGGREEAVESGGDTRPPEHPSTAATSENAAATCEKGDTEDDDVTMELMHQLSNEGDPGQDESRSPGYTTEESGDIMVKGSSSEDGKVKEKLARWERWNFKFKEVKKEPVELSSPEEQVRPVRGAPRQLHGYISRELGLLERLPGWHALPNGIVVHSKPMASHFHDPSSSFGDEWCGRLTLAKMTDGSDQWEQLENLANYKDTPLPFRPLPHGPRTTLTFVAPGLIKDYFVVTSEVPVSQYPLLNGEPASWPEDEHEDQEGGEIPWLAAGGGERPEIAEDVHFVDPDELEVSIDELTFNKDNKLKDLQDMCRKLGLPTSGSKVKVLRRLQQYKHHEEEKIAYEIAQRLYSEQRREAIPVKTPKLPTKHEQELHQLTHLPFQAWCQQCVATRAKEDVRTDADTADRKDRGRNVISFDYGYTYTSGAAEEKQWGTALYVAESESKAVLCIPVQAKGSLSLRQITEELTRFSMQVCNTQPIVFQSDGERATRQILRAVQHARASIGLTTEIRTTAREQHASNGQAERTVQSVRKLANTLRSFAEEKTGIKITGDMHCYPWSFRHAAWLMVRYRVINGCTSFEALTDRKYNGKVALWGETVLFKDVTAFRNKGDPVYKKGLWMGKSAWSDSHICLTRSGAVEARSIRRLPDQFDGQMLVNSKGLPWQYSIQGILMKSRFAARQRQAEAVEDAEGNEMIEQEAKTVGEDVALGMYGHGPVLGQGTPGFPLEGYPRTPGINPKPATPAPRTPARPAVAPATPGTTTQTWREKAKARPFPTTAEDESPSRKISRLPIPESMRGEPARNFMQDTEDVSPKRQKTAEAAKPATSVETERHAPGSSSVTTLPQGSLKRELFSLPWDAEDDEKLRMSPKKKVRAIQEEFPGGDDLLAEEILQSALNDVSEDEEGEGHAKERPPDVSEEELAALDDEACRHEERRLEQMGVLEKVKDGETDEEGSYVLTSKMVITWKFRDEQGGWFRRARLVGRQFKWSVFTEDSFAPTSASVVVRMLLRLQMQTGLALYTLDVKDAFLLMDQPADEKAMIVTNNGKYKLKKNLPGQRNAAAQWFKGFCAVARDYGMVQDVMQPTMMKKNQKAHDEGGGRLFLTIHVDDLLLIGDEEEVERFISYMEQKSWKVEKRGPLYQGNFSYLKRNMEMIENGIVIRPDKEHIKALAKVTNVENRKFRTTPGDSNFTKLSKDDEPMADEDVTKYRSAVGKILYIAPDRPDIQFVAQGLASLMQKPTKKAWRAMQHVSSYLLGTIDEGILLEHGPKGRSVLNVNEDTHEWEDDSKANLLEVICDADYAGQQATRKSVSSVQLYLNGGLMEPYVRCQRCIALSSGESEYVAMVGGCSEGLFLKHERKENEDNEETWWIRPLLTLVCLAVVGALSLTRWLWEKGRQWFNGRRVHDDGSMARQEPEEEEQPQEPDEEMDIEKVNMQWQIVRLEVAIAEKDEYLKEMTEEKDRMMNEYLRFADMNVNLRGQLDDLREENLGLTNRLLRGGGSRDAKGEEIRRLGEEVKRMKEANDLLKARIGEMKQEANTMTRQSLNEVKFVMDRKR